MRALACERAARKGRSGEETREGGTGGKDEERGTEERRTRAKRLARRDFSNFLCVLSSFPGYSGREHRSGSLFFYVSRPTADTVYRGIDVSAEAPFSPIVSSLVIERRDGRENERMGERSRYNLESRFLKI